MSLNDTSYRRARKADIKLWIVKHVRLVQFHRHYSQRQENKSYVYRLKKKQRSFDSQHWHIWKDEGSWCNAPKTFALECTLRSNFKMGPQRIDLLKEMKKVSISRSDVIKVAHSERSRIWCVAFTGTFKTNSLARTRRKALAHIWSWIPSHLSFSRREVRDLGLFTIMLANDHILLHR